MKSSDINIKMAPALLLFTLLFSAFFFASPSVLAQERGQSYQQGACLNPAVVESSTPTLVLKDEIPGAASGAIYHVYPVGENCNLLSEIHISELIPASSYMIPLALSSGLYAFRASYKHRDGRETELSSPFFFQVVEPPAKLAPPPPPPPPLPPPPPQTKGFFNKFKNFVGNIFNPPPVALSLDLKKKSDTGISNTDKITKLGTVQLFGTAPAGHTVVIYDETDVCNPRPAHFAAIESERKYAHNNSSRNFGKIADILKMQRAEAAEQCLPEPLDPYDPSSPVGCYSAKCLSLGLTIYNANPCNTALGPCGVCVAPTPQAPKIEFELYDYASAIGPNLDLPPNCGAQFSWQVDPAIKSCTASSNPLVNDWNWSWVKSGPSTVPSGINVYADAIYLDNVQQTTQFSLTCESTHSTPSNPLIGSGTATLTVDPTVGKTNTGFLKTNWTKTVKLAEGVHKLTAQAIDPAGNKSPFTTPLTVVVDTTPPVFDIPPIAKSSIPLQYNLSENVVSGPAALTLDIGVGSIISFTRKSGAPDPTTRVCNLTPAAASAGNHVLNFNTDCLPPVPAPLLPGVIYSVAVSGQDIAGNSAVANFKSLTKVAVKYTCDGDWGEGIVCDGYSFFVPDDVDKVDVEVWGGGGGGGRGANANNFDWGSGGGSGGAGGTYKYITDISVAPGDFFEIQVGGRGLGAGGVDPNCINCATQSQNGLDSFVKIYSLFGAQSIVAPGGCKGVTADQSGSNRPGGSACGNNGAGGNGGQDAGGGGGGGGAIYPVGQNGSSGIHVTSQYNGTAGGVGGLNKTNFNYFSLGPEMISCGGAGGNGGNGGNNGVNGSAGQNGTGCGTGGGGGGGGGSKTHPLTSGALGGAGGNGRPGRAIVYYYTYFNPVYTTSLFAPITVPITYSPNPEFTANKFECSTGTCNLLVPQGTKITIEIWGGGGGGGGGGEGKNGTWGSDYGGGGGAGGQFGEYKVESYNVSLPLSLKLNVGAGGSGGPKNNDGGAGGTSSVVFEVDGTTIVSAAGGKGGKKGNSAYLTNYYAFELSNPGAGGVGDSGAGSGGPGGKQAGGGGGGGRGLSDSHGASGSGGSEGDGGAGGTGSSNLAPWAWGPGIQNCGHVAGSGSSGKGKKSGGASPGGDGTCGAGGGGGGGGQTEKGGNHQDGLAGGKGGDGKIIIYIK